MCEVIKYCILRYIIQYTELALSTTRKKVLVYPYSRYPTTHTLSLIPSAVPPNILVSIMLAVCPSFSVCVCVHLLLHPNRAVKPLASHHSFSSFQTTIKDEDGNRT